MSESIHDFWNKQALELPKNAVSTHRDLNQSLLEIDVLTKHIETVSPRENLLVVGCGNGYTASKLARYCENVSAIDYAENFACSPHLKGINFKVANVTKLPFDADKFDVVVSKRCLINLPSWKMQKQAIHEVHRVLKKDGTFLMLEATEQGYAKLNRMRESVGLGSIKVAWHNKPVDADKLKQEFSNVTTHPILDLYYFISRIVHPLLVQPEEPRYDAKINVVARLMEQKMSLPSMCSPLTLFELVK